MASASSPTTNITETTQSPVGQSPVVDNTTAKRVSKPPPGYKFVKVRKPDGSIVTVKRKLSPEELESSQISSTQNNTSQPQPVITEKTGQTSPPLSPALSSSTPASPTKFSDHDGTVQQSDPSQASPASQIALDEQASENRTRRMSRFRDSMIRGLATVVSQTVPTVAVGDWHHGDEVVDHEDDPSDNDFADDDDEDDEQQNHHDKDLEEKTSHLNSSENNTSGQTTQLQTGAAANALAAAATARTAPHPDVQAANQTTPATNQAGQKGNEKSTYNINIKEVNKIEEKRTEDERKLSRHWANFSFYFMASLSIILPLLFIALAIAICLMNNKLVHSNWHKVEDAIKIAISAWPIVFAAVVAQVFKSYATYKVERGIKLMELEQLIGSNSFGSAMKQPFILRRLDLLTLFLFIVWCLSPLGSQGLQRAFGKDKRHIDDKQDVWYLNTNGFNSMFSSNANRTSTDRGARIQIVSAYYLSAFLPKSMRDLNAESTDQDRYDNPHISYPGPSIPSQYVSQNRSSISAYGVPFSLPKITFRYDPSQEQRDVLTHVEDVNYDHIVFKMTGSYYNLTCGDWSLKRFNDLKPLVHLSDNYEFGIGMQDRANIGTSPNGSTTYSTNYRPNYVAFASRNRNALTRSAINVTTPPDSADYSFMECSYDRVYVEEEVDCMRVTLQNLIPSCFNYLPNVTRVQGAQNPQDQFLMDFAEEWVEATGISDSVTLTSTTESFIAGGLGLDDPYQRDVDFSNFNLSKAATPEDFEWYFGYAFNTWINLGYCPECIDANSYNFMPEYRKPLYLQSKGERTSTGDQIYILYPGWFALYIICSIILLLAGIGSVLLECLTVAPDVLGYVSTVARNSRYLHLPKTNSAMSGGERARTLGGVEVMMQDVKAKADIGRIALGMKHDDAQRLQPGRLYR